MDKNLYINGIFNILIIYEQICLLLYESIFKKDIMLIFELIRNKINRIIFFSKPLKWNKIQIKLFEFYLNFLHNYIFTSLLENILLIRKKFIF